MEGTEGPDRIQGGDGAEALLGLRGADTLLGGGGRDRLYGGAGADSLDGGAGDDSVSGGAGDDVLAGGAGADTVFGGSGDDTIWTSGADRAGAVEIIDAGSGDDFINLTGGGGLKLSLGEGRDSIQLWTIGAGDGERVITDFQAGDGGDWIFLLSQIENQLPNQQGDSLFRTGHLRLVQSGEDVLLQGDRDGTSGQGASLTTILRLEGVDATSLTRSNFRYDPIVSENITPTMTGSLHATMRAGSTHVVRPDELGFTDPEEADVSFRVDPANGVFVTVAGVTTSSFTSAQLAAGQVAFSHYSPFHTHIQFGVTVSDGNSSASPALFTIDVVPADFQAIAQDDSFVLTQKDTSGNVFDDNGAGADVDPDRPLAVVAVNGAAASVGQWTKLPSGISVRLNSDGSLTAAAGENLAAPGSGAANTYLSGSFTYTLAGGQTATADVVVVGIDDDDHVRGSAGADRLHAGIGDDTIDGGGGGDLLYGGKGDDLYILRDAADQLVEREAEGQDRVLSFVSVALPENVERVDLQGTADLDATGGDGRDFLIGNAGANVLDGGGGRDRLKGGAGADVFLFSSAPLSSEADRISDFEGADRIALDSRVFSGLAKGELDASAFHLGATADDGADRILYDIVSGGLFFDRDGSGTTYHAVRFAVLANHAALTADDVVIV
ncbi:hypothetical protein METY_1392 [Methylopila sp. Yamaguchi]|nr:hypothetical protein METY_1392 [Methylopila sp. Yamaguchi]